MTSVIRSLLSNLTRVYNCSPALGYRYLREWSIGRNEIFRNLQIFSKFNFNNFNNLKNEYTNIFVFIIATILLLYYCLYYGTTLPLRVFQLRPMFNSNQCL